MSYLAIGAEASLETIQTTLLDVAKRQEDEASRRKIALWFGIGSALFAAARLGILFAPEAKRRIKARGT